jgi:Flp pilus assembly protein TadD
MNVRNCRYLLLMLAVGVSACDQSEVVAPDRSALPVDEVALSYVGAAACAECHVDEVTRWEGSDHDRAMQVANEQTVLGDFNDTLFAHNGVDSVLKRQDEKFIARTDGPNGVLADFPIRYTFGVDPLQQYLAELPDGKIQTLPIAWDTRPEAEGGQHWLHVYGDDPIDYTDVLHWTRMSQNWDSQCADCHSTGLVKQYDVATDTFNTRWEEINVSCEACHGAGSRHVAWAQPPGDAAGKGLSPALTERRDIGWILDDATGNSRRSQPRTSSVEIDTCAPCHSRRSRISDSPVIGAQFLDAYAPAMVMPPLYYPDGQIHDEVYVYGSFLQSRMYQHGVTCSDCHEPHNLELRAPGSAVCAQCHDAKKFQSADHHFHPENSAGADCLGCHMSSVTYMQVDTRRDHSFRVPRPALSVGTGIPNACTNCHTDKDAAWAQKSLEKNKPPVPGRVPHWSERMTAALYSPMNARNLLLGLAADPEVPAIIRASAMSALQLAGDEMAVTVISKSSNSTDPIVRWGVARAFQTADPGAKVKYLPKLLGDPVKSVRIAAASGAATLSPEELPTESYLQLEQSLDDYVSAQMINSERAEAHVNLGNLSRNRNRLDQSETSYRTAIRLNPYFVPAYVNLADLYRVQQRESDGEAALREALQKLPDQSSLHHSLGLLLIRTERIAEAAEELGIAAESPDADPRYALAYALALDGQGYALEARTYLQSALDRFGDDPTLVAVLVDMYQRGGDEEAAGALMQRLQRP